MVSRVVCALALVASALQVREPVEPSAPRAALTGVVLDERGAPLAGWFVGALDSYSTLTVLASRVDSVRWAAESFTDDAGRFFFANSPGPSFALVARAPDDSALVVHEAFTLDAPEGVVVRVRAEDRRTSFVEGELVGPEGEALTAKGGAFSTTLYRSHVASFEGSHFRIGPLAAGEYELSFWSDAHLPLRTRCAVGPGETLALGRLRLERPGWLEARVRDPLHLAKPGPIAAASVTRDGLRWSGIALADGSGRSEDLAPGRYVVRETSLTWRALAREVEVRAGETATVELELEPSSERVLRMHVLPDDPSTHVHLRVLDAAGGVVEEDEHSYRKDDHFTTGVDGLTPGVYRVDARAASGRIARAEFTVEDLDATAPPLDLELR